MSLVDQLQEIVKGEVDVSNEARETAARDTSLFYIKPEVVVRPQDAQDICNMVVLVSNKNKNEPYSRTSLTARSAGTDMSGGPLNDSVIVDMMTHLNKLVEMGDGYAVVEPGMYYRDFDKKTKERGFILPSYTASREINTVGGMVANNSGGERNLKYGKTARYVQELEVVLADGKVYRLQHLAGEALQEKLKQQNFEGELYRRVSRLVSQHQKLILQHAPKVSKNSSGYAIWEIGDGKNSLDLARLMVGSQGTLGIITKIRFSLVRPKKYSSMVIMFLHDLESLRAIIPAVLDRKPDSFESYDDNTFTLALKYFPELAGQMKHNLLTLGLSFLPEAWMTLTGGVPKLVLLVEFRADSQEEALTKAQDLEDELAVCSPEVTIRVARDEEASAKYWAVRRESFNLLRKKVRGKRTAPFIDDFVIDPMTIPEFMPKLNELIKQYDFVYTIAGHIGDGNFHIIPLIDPARVDLAEMVKDLSTKVYDLVLEYQGSITGEHNDGLIRTPYIEQMFGREMTALFNEIKNIFDPLNIFNPGKKVGMTISKALSYLDKPPAAS